ncbi:MAG: hypothetical protein DRP57_07670 [Spirochaetes bacterium]|nr:MAG: hypothetical protein DRP57_07670 [Spirochaetota bacterium]
MNILSLNPIAALLAVILNSIPVFISFDIYTPVVFLVLALLNTILISNIKIKIFLKLFLPLTLLPVSLFFLNLFFSAPLPPYTKIHIFIFVFYNSSFHRACVIFLRSLTLIYISISYLAAVDVLDLINALMQQLHLSPKIGYSIYTAWNIIPYIKNETLRIKNIHLIRFRGEKQRIRETIQFVVTVLINAIRHSERAAVSMTVRGLENKQKRTFLNKSEWKFLDTLYSFVYTFISTGLLLVLINRGLFNFGIG